ncbi:MAG: hypothetical protein ACO1TE_01875 [Prosthecobacter sp.]
MDSPAPSADLPAAPPPTAPPKRTGKPSFMEDMIVTAFGFATSTGVAWLSWWMAAHWDFAIYTWMFWFVVPMGAVGCGFAAATGYWLGARLFNHRPSKWMLFNIVLVSFTTFFAIHHFHYTNDQVMGRPLSSLMSYEDYLVEVTENMTYKSSRGGSNTPGTPLGKLGWGVAALQVIGFSVGGFVVHGMLLGVPYCGRCSKYLSQKKTKVARWKEPEMWRSAFDEVAGLMQQGQLQAAIDKHATLGEDRRTHVNSMLTLLLRKCPDCEARRLVLTARRTNGNQLDVVASASVNTEEPLHMT